MSDRINDFLDKICASVKYKTMHSEIREEFKNHRRRIKPSVSYAV